MHLACEYKTFVHELVVYNEWAKRTGCIAGYMKGVERGDGSGVGPIL